MASGVTKTGISVVGNVPWGSHFCHFYETKQDLLDILAPYFAAGLEKKEYCLWVLFDPLEDAAEALEALRRAGTAVDQKLADGDIEVMPYSQWYLKDGVF